MKQSKIIVGVIAIVFLVFIGYGLMKKHQPSINSGQKTAFQRVNVGAVLALTGELATYAEGEKNGIKLAIEKNNFQDKINLAVEDDHTCTPADAVSAAQKLITVDNVVGIIGATCTGSTLAMTSITGKSQVVVISPSATGKNITTAGDYVFRTIASDADKNIAIAKYAYGKGYRKAAFLADESQDALATQKDDTRSAFLEEGGTSAVEEIFVSTDKDLRSQLAKIKNSDADVIFVSATPETLGIILKQANAIGVKLPFIATDTSGGTQPVIDIAGSLAEGLIFPSAITPDNKESKQFAEDYKKKFGIEPNIYAAEAYDAASLLIRSILESDGSKNQIKNKLFEIGNNYPGASGIITFDKNGDVQKQMLIETIRNGKTGEIK